MISAIKNLLCATDNSVLTQLPMFQHPGHSIVISHIVVAFSLYFVQVEYDLLGVTNLKEMSIWLLVTANSMICFFGSCRGFDRVAILELFVAAFMSFYHKLYLIIPVIAVMLYQTYLRYDGSYIFGAPVAPESDPDTDSVFHENHPDNWRNWMHTRDEDPHEE